MTKTYVANSLLLIWPVSRFFSLCLFRKQTASSPSTVTLSWQLHKLSG